MNHRYKIKIYLFLLFMSGFSCYTFAQQTTPETQPAVKSDSVKSNRVNVAYGQQPAGTVVQSISSVKGNELEKTFNTNLGNILIGRIAGLTTVPGNNEPGINTPNLYSRGLSTLANGASLGTSTTIGSSTAPLVIVDGFLGDYTQLLPSEIESVQLLKDAAATAMYGMKGANGVLLITTKRGTPGPFKINVSTQQGFSQAAYLPTFLDSYGYAALYNEALTNEGKPVKYSADDLAAYRNNTDPVYHPNVNWYDQVLRKTAPLSNYNVNFTGGDNNVKYFVLLNAINQQGLLKKFGDQDSQSSNSTYSRYNFRTNVDVNINKATTVALTLGGTVENKGNPAAYNTGGIFNYIATLPPNSFPVYNPNGSFATATGLTNPVATLLKTGFYSTNGRTLQSSLRLTRNLDGLTKGLSISGVVSLNSYFTSYSNKSKQVQLSVLSKDASGNPVYTTTGTTTSLVGSESQSDQYRNFAAQGQLSYDRTFGRHRISAVALVSTDDYTVSYAAGIDGLTSQPYKHNTVAGRVNYAFSEKYIGEFSYAYMGSNDFPPAKRYGFFPAGAIGWVVSKENFLKDNSAITFLKIRASYGVTGNDNINASRRYLFDPYVGFTTQALFGTGNTAYNSLAEAASNPGLTWEKQKTSNIGLDATLFKVVDFSFDYFKNERYDILVSSANVVPQYLGAPLAALNKGKINNTGIEASLRYNGSQTKKLRYYVAANVSYAKNTIIYNAEAPQINPYQLQAGTSLGSIRGYVAQGFFTSAQDVLNSPKPAGLKLQPGDIKYQDLGGPNGVPDGIIDGYDTRVLGKSNLPQVTLGLNTGLQYGGFDLNIVVQGVTGRNVYIANAYTNAFQGNGQISEIALDRWTPATAATATFPRLSTNGDQNNYQVSSFWVKNGSFIKLRSAELGYSLPKPLISRIKLSGARLFVQGTNLFSIDHVQYGDPETLNGYPPLRTVSLGAKVQL